MASDSSFTELFTGFPAALLQGGVDTAAGFLGSGGLANVAETLIKSQFPDNPAISSMFGSMVSPVLTKLNNAIVDEITGSSDWAIPLSVFANTKGFGTNIRSAQTKRYSNVLKGDAAFNTKGFSRSLTERMAGSLGYSGDELKAFVANDSFFGKTSSGIYASQLDDIADIGRGVVSDWALDDLSQGLGIRDEKTGEYGLDTKRGKALAAQLSSQIAEGFYGTGNRGRRFGSMSISDVGSLTELASRQAGGNIGSGTPDEIKNKVTQITNIVEKMAGAVDNVRDVLGRQVSAGDAIKFLSQMSGTNVANMSVDTITALSKDFRDIGVRNGLSVKEIGQIVSGGTQFYSTIGLSQNRASRLELDRLGMWGKSDSRVLGLSDETLTAERRKAYAEDEVSGVTLSLANAYNVYASNSGKAFSQSGYDEFVKSLQGKGVSLRSLTSTEGARSALSKLGVNVSGDAIETLLNSSRTYEVMSSINVTQPLQEQRLVDMRNTANKLFNQLGGAAKGIGFDDLFSTAVDYNTLAKKTGVSAVALQEMRQKIINQGSAAHGVDARVYEQYLSERAEFEKATKDLGLDNYSRVAKGMQGISQVLAGGGDVSWSRLAAAGILGLDIGDEKKAESVLTRMGGKAAKSIALTDDQRKELNAVIADKSLTGDQKTRALYDTLRKQTGADNMPDWITSMFTGYSTANGRTALESLEDKGDKVAAFLHGKGASAAVHMKGIKADSAAYKEMQSAIDTLSSSTATESDRKAALDKLKKSDTFTTAAEKSARDRLIEVANRDYTTVSSNAVSTAVVDVKSNTDIIAKNLTDLLTAFSNAVAAVVKDGKVQTKVIA
jgi:hypothetical protein